MDYRSTGWFSGFADGEGTFGLYLHSKGSYIFSFRIGLRADEKPILSKLQGCFGGNLCFTPVSEKQLQRMPGSNPQYHWNVGAKADQLRLIEYFDEFPLQAKKAAEYKVWREAAKFYFRYALGGGPGRSNPQWLCRIMDDYVAELSRLKKYEAQPLELEAKIEDGQLSLMEEEEQ